MFLKWYNCVASSKSEVKLDYRNIAKVWSFIAFHVPLLIPVRVCCFHTIHTGETTDELIGK